MLRWSSSPRIAFLALAIGVGAAHADDWSHWRGPTRDGHSRETSHFVPGWTFPRESAWQADVGHGGSSPLIVAGKAKDLKHGAMLAAKSIETGEAEGRLDRLIAVSNAVEA